MKVLVLEDDPDHGQYLEDLINSWGHETIQAPDGIAGLEAVAAKSPDVILTDLQMPRMDGLEFLSKLQGEGSSAPIIVMTAFGSIELAIRTVHELGAFWFVEKPVTPEVLQVLMDRAGRQSRLAMENLELKRQLSFSGVLDDMVGQAPLMREIFGVIRQVAPTDASVLITGESGTGKELVARAIHRNSRRADRPFLALNCAALPETLMESELFGHEKGAFTGAFDRRLGSLEQASGGTLFLDELGEMPLAMQAKLLRVLEDLTFRRLGGKHELKAEVRFVAATNQEPLHAIKDGKLREDLYYRLNVFRIHLPPLRERVEDIPLIVEHMITRLNQKHHTTITEATESFLGELGERRWPGNIRELRNVVERAIIVASSGPLKPEHLLFAWRAEQPSAAIDQKPAQQPSVAADTSADGRDNVAIPVGSTIGDAERLLIEATLAKSGNNKTQAARTLGISTKTLHAKLNQYRTDSVAAYEETE